MVQLNPPADALPERSDPSMVRPAPVAPQTPAGPCWSRGMIHIECREAVALLTLDRADKLNAIDRGFWEDLPTGLDWAVQQGMRVILFTGAGKRAFSVGGDIGSFAELTTAEARETTAALLRMVEQDEARAMLANLDRKDPSASTWDLVGLEVRVSEADVAAGKHIRHLVEEVAGADVVVWALPGGIVTERQRAALAAIAEHFKITPSLLAPAILPVELKNAAASPASVM